MARSLLRHMILPLPGREDGAHRIAYREWGDRTSPLTAVCVHGLTRNSKDFEVLAESLAAKYRVLCPDIAGRGESEWFQDSYDYHYGTYLSDMQGFMDRLEVEGALWIGTSMGGLIGMMLAATQPGRIRKLVMNDIGPFLPKEGLKRIADYVGKDMQFATRAEAEAKTREVMKPFGIKDEAHWKVVLNSYIRDLPDGSARLNYDPRIAEAFVPGEGETFEDVDLWNLWEAVQCPVLVLRGAQSDVLSAETAARMAKKERTRLITYPGIGHAPGLMEAKQIQDVLHFLAEEEVKIDA